MMEADAIREIHKITVLSDATAGSGVLGQHRFGSSLSYATQDSWHSLMYTSISLHGTIIDTKGLLSFINQTL